jgi:hypothetical protein
MEPEKSLFSLVDDVRRQREIAQEALNEAKQIDVLLQEVKDNPTLKQKLEDRKAGVLKVARDLVANAAATSSSVASTLSTITLLGNSSR